MRLLRFAFVFVVLLFSQSGFAEYENLREALRGIRILVVPGFLPRPGVLAVAGIHRTYEKMVEVFREMGLDAELSQASPGSSIADGARTVAREIARSDKRVLAIGHSLGGNKILHAVIDSPAASANTAGIILIQSPLHGSIACEIGQNCLEPETPYLDAHEMATDGMEAMQEGYLNLIDPFGIGRALFDPFQMRRLPYRAARAANHTTRRAVQFRTQSWFQALHGGDARVFTEASRRNAEAYLDDNRDRLRELSRLFPILSVTSSAYSPGSRALQLTLLGRGLDNDGVVETSSQNLGYGMQMSVDIDHLGFVLESSRHADSLERCLQVLVSANSFTP